MTRLRDRWEHLLLAARDNDKTKQYENYSDWLDRIGCNETDDDLGKYGDENPTWGNEEIREVEE